MTAAAKYETTSAPPAVLLETRVRGFAPKNATAIGLESSVSFTLRWGSWQIYDRTAVDRLVGLDYFGARYFSAAQGRFASPDWSAIPQPVPYADLTDPQTLNLYSYVRNNPLSKVDPDGHCGIWGDRSCTFTQWVQSIPQRVVGGLKFEANAALEIVGIAPKFQPSNAEQADAMAAGEQIKPEFQQAILMAIPGPKGAKEPVEPFEVGEVLDTEIAVGPWR